MSIPSTPPSQNVTLAWSEEPVIVEPMFPPPPPKYEPWDLLVLRSSSPAPFSSLERWLKCPHTRSCQSHPCYATAHFNSPQKFTTPKKLFHSKIPASPSFPVDTTSLDWDRDPCLSNLSSVLKALGWVQGFWCIILLIPFLSVLSHFLLLLFLLCGQRRHCQKEGSRWNSRMCTPGHVTHHMIVPYICCRYQ